MTLKARSVEKLACSYFMVASLQVEKYFRHLLIRKGKASQQNFQQSSGTRRNMRHRHHINNMRVQGLLFNTSESHLRLEYNRVQTRP